MSKKTTLGMVNSGNGYVITVKNNQPSLYQAIEAQAQAKPLDAHSWQQTGHGHDTRGRIKVWDADEIMMTKWAGWQRYVSVRRQGIRNGKAIDTTIFYMTSEPLSAWCLAQIIRNHRQIENPLHWTKDVVQNEDDCGLAGPHAAVNIAVIRNISFN